MRVFVFSPWQSQSTTIRTRKFLTNRLLSRKQMVSTSPYPHLCAVTCVRAVTSRSGHVAYHVSAASKCVNLFSATYIELRHFSLVLCVVLTPNNVAPICRTQAECVVLFHFSCLVTQAHMVVIVISCVVYVIVYMSCSIVTCCVVEASNIIISICLVSTLATLNCLLVFLTSGNSHAGMQVPAYQSPSPHSRTPSLANLSFSMNLNSGHKRLMVLQSKF